VAQDVDVGPEFKPHYCKKKKKRVQGQPGQLSSSVMEHLHKVLSRSNEGRKEGRKEGGRKRGREGGKTG
jgi:hypothetical protein